MTGPELLRGAIEFILETLGAFTLGGVVFRFVMCKRLAEQERHLRVCRDNALLLVALARTRDGGFERAISGLVDQEEIEAARARGESYRAALWGTDARVRFVIDNPSRLSEALAMMAADAAEVTA